MSHRETSDKDIVTGAATCPQESIMTTLIPAANYTVAAKLAIFG